MSYSPLLGAERRAGEASSGLPSSASIRDTLSGAINSTKAYLQPFAPGSPYLGHNGVNGQSEPGRLLADVAPQLMTTRMMAAVTNSNTALGLTPDGQRRARLLLTPGFSITSPARSLVRIGGSLIQSGIGRGPMTGITSHELFVLEESDRILATAAQDLDLDANQTGPRAAIEGAKSKSEPSVSLLRGFQASIPSATEGRQRRRRVRAIASGFEDGPEGPTKLGLKAMGEKARGLMVEGLETESVSAFQAREQRHARRNQASRVLSRGKDGGRTSTIELEELERQLCEIEREQDDVGVRRSLIDSELATVDAKIKVLEKIKAGLNKKLLGLREEELELNDEHEGVGELLAVQKHLRAMPGGPAAAANAGASGATASQGSSRRRKGPLFMPSEHDELPSGVAFMTLADHSAPITSLDFTEPYGTLVSASLDETVRVWDLASGDEVGRLRGHTGPVKCLQVEDEVCITGGADNTIRIWDLTKVENFEARLTMTASGELPARRRSPDPNRNSNFAAGEESMDSIKIRDGDTTIGDEEDQELRDEFDPCVKSLEGHSKSVTSLYFDDNCLVTGASDKTLRQWDLNTGQCVLTMDILWAISNPTSSQAISQSEFGFPESPSRKASSSAILGPTRPDLSSRDSFSVLNNLSGAFAYPTPPCADGSWEMYQDFVGGVQFWGYALASGSGDGGVRMWDMRTGQAHRTLLGHTAPVTCLQFDEHHIISGSLDKSIRIWDLRMGSISDTIRYDHPVTALQFDSRKILAATGENGVKIFNRTTLQHGGLTLNGHTSPVERLRYMDRYAVSGGKDSVVKIWAL
ncbi:related to CAF4 - CCR4 associated factor [Melanopsichium pennsylvanicum]|uniref:Mitochondrial division protein 1 n=2 Tax=Melanopsichium pennsylvanicum TaxID=63383 RepID=A0AAJ4XNQ0_9BASI|nr:related to CAF4-CCR4 associated factor [Melanopsichium pennsylvanicum 4]SNX85985.1 related to CAF4 - CCR4 associated factor [Melanopsichium pennsylvanicum]